jgi:type III secretion protein Q
MAGVKRLDCLRRINSQAYQATQATLRWRALGHSASLRVPEADRNYLRFVARGPEGVWQGAMQTQQWLSRVVPQLQALLPAGCCEERVAHLFEAVARPFQSRVGELLYSSLSGVERVPGSALGSAALPCLDTPEGELWLTSELPAGRPPCAALPAWVEGLALTLRMVMGVGQLQPRQRAQLACGDVLVIGERTQHLSMAEHRVGLFTLTEEGFRMEFNSSASPLPASAEQHQPPVCDVQAMQHLPLNLEFMLQETVCSLAELAGFQAGQVLPLNPGAQHSVQVRAGGQLLAVGELVQWENGLGVELHTLMDTAGSRQPVRGGE